MIVGIRYNKKFSFWVVYKNHNQKNQPDVKEFFVDEKEARERMRELNVQVQK